jgi:hypothetical protein
MHLDEIGEARPITESDLAELRSAPKVPTPPRKQLRYKHHALARSLAAGMQESVAAAITGFAPVTVSILKRDPAFADLVRFYASEEGKGFDQVRAQILGVGLKFIEEIDRRVSEEPGEVTMKDLRETGTVLLDRAGFGPAQSSTHDVHIHTGLADAIKASRVNAPFPALPGAAPSAAPVIDGEFEELPSKDEGAQRTSFRWDD